MDATTPPSLADDIAEALAYANQGPSLSRETTRRLVRELTERTAGLDHLQRLFRLATRVEQRVGDAVVCSCTWSYGRPGVRTARPADCPVHGGLADGQPTEPTEADPDAAIDNAVEAADGEMAEGRANFAEWRSLFLAELAAQGYGVRALVGGRPAPSGLARLVTYDAIEGPDYSVVPSVVIPHPTGTRVRVTLDDSVGGRPTAPTPEAVAQHFHETYERLAPSFGYETRKASAVPWNDVPDQNKRLMIAVAGEVVALLSRSAAEPKEHGDG